MFSRFLVLIFFMFSSIYAYAESHMTQDSNASFSNQTIKYYSFTGEQLNSLDEFKTHVILPEDVLKHARNYLNSFGEPGLTLTKLSPDEKYIQSLIHVLNDSDYRVALSAVLFIGVSKPMNEQINLSLAKALNYNDQAVGLAAFWALKEIKPKMNKKLFEELLAIIEAEHGWQPATHAEETIIKLLTAENTPYYLKLSIEVLKEYMEAQEPRYVMGIIKHMNPDDEALLSIVDLFKIDGDSTIRALSYLNPQSKVVHLAIADILDIQYDTHIDQVFAYDLLRLKLESKYPEVVLKMEEYQTRQRNKK